MAGRETLVEAPAAPVAAPPVAAPAAPAFGGLLGFTGAGDHSVGADLLLGLQATAGNASVGRLLSRSAIARQQDEPADGGVATLPPERDAGVPEGGLPGGVPDPAPRAGEDRDDAPADPPGGLPGGVTTPNPQPRGAPAADGGVTTTTGGGGGGGGGAPTGARDAGGGGAPPAVKGGVPEAGAKGSAAERLGSLDEKVRALMESRKDPQAEAAHDDHLQRADMARLAALQYTYAPNDSFLVGLLKPMLPLDQMGERITSLWSGNQYASSANANTTSGKIAKVQSVIETIRQVLRLAGDIVGAGSTVLGYVSIISGLIALIPPAAPIAGPIAAFSASMSLTLTGIKVVIDLIDAVLGVVQLGLLAWRAHASKGDPTERARIAMLLRREAGEVAGSLVSAGVGAATYGLGKYALKKVPAGQAASDAAQAAAMQAGLAGMGRQLMARNLKAAFSGATWKEMGKVVNAIKTAQAVGAAAKNASGTTVISMARLNKDVFFQALRSEMAAAAISAQKAAAPSWHAGAKVWVLGKIQSSLKPKLPSIGVKLPGQATKFGAGQGRRQKSVQGDAKVDPTKPAGTGESGEATAQEQRYHYWPSVVERYATMRADIKVARERAQEQHDRALQDAGKSGEAVLTIKGAATKNAGKLGAAGKGIGTDADAAKASADETEKQAVKGKEKGAQADEKRKKADDDRKKAKEDANRADEEAIAAARRAREEGGWFSGAKNWVMKKIGNAFKALQNKLSEWILSAAMAAAGMDPKELDMAAMQAEASKDKDASGKAKEDADAMAEDDKRQTEAMKSLMEGAGDAEQNAIRGVSDTLDYIRDLDAWDEVLAQAEEQGTSYVEGLTPILGTQVGPKEGEETVKAADVQPILLAAEYVTLSTQNGAANFESTCVAQLDQGLGEVSAAFADHFEGGVDTSVGAAIGGAFAQSLAKDLHGRLEAAGKAATDLTASANSAVGTPGFTALAEMGSEAEGLVAEVDDALTVARTAWDAALQEILDAYSAAAVDAVQEHARQGSPQAQPDAPEDDGGGPNQSVAPAEPPAGSGDPAQQPAPAGGK